MDTNMASDELTIRNIGFVSTRLSGTARTSDATKREGEAPAEPDRDRH
jgi:hypothetical protein